MEVIEHFGINPILIAAQIVNFLIILYILKRFLYKPIFAVFKKREQTIKEGMAKAEESKKVLDQALTKEKKIIKDAQDTAKKIIQDARDQAQLLSKGIEEKTKKQSDRMIEDAKVQIELETKKAELSLNKHVSDLSVKFLKKSLPDVFTAKEQTEIVSRAVKELNKRPN
jgi:F-type H+-transporting ATPase subunit b